jgi:valyl-tRNA synthetase
MRTEVSRAVVRGPGDQLERIGRAQDDLRAAGRIVGDINFEPVTDAPISVDVDVSSSSD